MTQAPIVIEGVGKVFDLHKRRRRAGVSTTAFGVLGPLWRNVLRRRTLTKRPFHALADVSVAVGRGEIMGVIGRNGAGKSTLLKILARVMDPSAGRIELHGRVASLLELGSGFSGDLSVIENIRLQLALSGERGNVALENAMIALAELEEYRDADLDDCPPGSAMKLSFAAMISMNAEIILADEMLAVGDRRYREMCLERIRDVRSKGGSVLFVSHDLGAIAELCDRAMWLDRGRVRAIGPAAAIVRAYETEVLAGEDRPGEAGDACRIIDFRLTNAQGGQIGAMSAASAAHLECLLAHRVPDQPIAVTVELRARKRVHLFSDAPKEPILSDAPRTVRVRMKLPAGLLGEGRYHALIRARWRGASGEPGLAEAALTFDVLGADLPAGRMKGLRRGMLGPVLRWQLDVAARRERPARRGRKASP